MTVMYTCITAIPPGNSCTLGALLPPVVRHKCTASKYSRNSHIQTSVTKPSVIQTPTNDIHRYFTVAEMENDLLCKQIVLFVLSKHPPVPTCLTSYW